MSPPAPAPRTARTPWPWVLGVQSWLVWVMGPRAFRGLLDPVTDPLGTAAALLPAAVLAMAWWMERRGRPGTTLSLGVFPPSLALGLLGFDNQHALATYSPLVLAVGAASLLGYAATAASAAGQREALRPCSMHPLGQSHQASTDPRRALAQQLLLGISFAALLCLIVVSGSGAALRYHETWGQSAAAGATLAGTLSGLIGAVAMAGVIGPALRAERTRSSSRARERNRRRRVLWLMAVAVSGAVAYALLRATES